VAGERTEKGPGGPLRALSEWLRGRTRAPEGGTAPVGADGLPARLGRYAITGKLGQGGMGIVYAAWDERLERAVALKTMSSLGSDETARKRFWREARAAASVNHPNICQLHEIGEDGGELFITMELLEGEPLSARLRGGSLGVGDSLPIVLAILSALEALHARGIVHRDLKPSNVFLTPHGVKLLDFGLARPTGPELASASGADLTRTGMVVGTPRYMAPEQVTGDEPDARTDLFAVGAILFEMLAGRPAFEGRTVVEIVHATLYEQPPALTGSPTIAAVDRTLRRALAKRAEDRPASAAAMAEELAALRGGSGDETKALARALTRLVVLPFRALRPDPETDFLAFSLPDAISSSLARLGSLVVRSSATAARFAGDAPDLKAVATEADVDRVVTGTLLRAGDQLRVATQLVEAPAGTLLASHTVEASLGDLFRLQDDIARRMVEALSLPLGGSEAFPTPQAPHDARAYGLYLRANEQAQRYATLPAARDLYRQCLDLDPGFAPAWAQLGRCERVIDKFIGGSGDGNARSEEAFRRALELDPRLTLGHRFYAHLEAETGKPRDAMVRLLHEAQRHGNDAELFAGLVHACRYCGLLEQAVAAHEEARRLDPNVPTSLEQTLLLTGELDRLLAIERRDGGRGDEMILAVALGMAGRRAEAHEVLGATPDTDIEGFRVWKQALHSWLDGRLDDLKAAATKLAKLKVMEDPEALFEKGWLACEAGAHAEGIVDLQRALSLGYAPAETLQRSRGFDGVREDPAFRALLAQAEREHARSLEAFREHGGERLLGRLPRAAA